MYIHTSIARLGVLYLVLIATLVSALVTPYTTLQSAELVEHRSAGGNVLSQEIHDHTVDREEEQEPLHVTLNPRQLNGVANLIGPTAQLMSKAASRNAASARSRSRGTGATRARSRSQKVDWSSLKDPDTGRRGGRGRAQSQSDIRGSMRASSRGQDLPERGRTLQRQSSFYPGGSMSRGRSSASQYRSGASSLNRGQSSGGRSQSRGGGRSQSRGGRGHSIDGHGPSRSGRSKSRSGQSNRDISKPRMDMKQRNKSKSRERGSRKDKDISRSRADKHGRDKSRSDKHRKGNDRDISNSRKNRGGRDKSRSDKHRNGRDKSLNRPERNSRSKSRDRPEKSNRSKSRSKYPDDDPHAGQRTRPSGSKKDAKQKGSNSKAKSSESKESKTAERQRETRGRKTDTTSRRDRSQTRSRSRSKNRDPADNERDEHRNTNKAKKKEEQSERSKSKQRAQSQESGSDGRKTPVLQYDSNREPETVDNKIKGKIPSTLHPLPEGEKQYRGDARGEHAPPGQWVDHAVPASFQEGKERSKEGTNRLAPAAKGEQKGEGGKTRVVEQKAKERGKDHVNVEINDQPAGKVSGNSPSPQAPGTPDRNEVETTGPSQSVLENRRKRHRVTSSEESNAKRSIEEDLQRLSIRGTLDAIDAVYLNPTLNGMF